jgi:thioredoxin reductase
MSGRWEQVAQTPLAKPQESADVAVIGGGPAGLTAAARLRQLLPGAKVVVLEREAKAGGIPRHAFHQGYGLRDLHKSLTGPAYAQRLADAAATAGADLRLHTQVTGWSADGALELTSPAGVAHLYARAVVLASGCRERPRSARLVAGSRPRGVMNTGTLQQLVYLRGKAPGTRALVVGAEHVAFSAVATLAHGGARTVAVTTELPRHQSYGALRWAATARYATVPDIGTAVAPRPSPLPKPPPVLAHTAVMEIHGRERVTGVTVLDLRSGESRVIECDTVVFTGDWLPDHELAVSAGLVLDAGTRGPRVDGALRTEREGLFAAGNVLHGAETGGGGGGGGGGAARPRRPHGHRVPRWQTVAPGIRADRVRTTAALDHARGHRGATDSGRRDAERATGRATPRALPAACTRGADRCSSLDHTERASPRLGQGSPRDAGALRLTDDALGRLS